jgi:PhzF family phenazine biosynthesis protein
MKVPIYQVDAFASSLFRGNPAAVCPLDSWLPDQTLQAIAAENNLAETAYYVPRGPGRYGLRWFTPKVEVDLCGHATLATSAVILGIRREFAGERLVFETLSGELTVEREGDLYALNFPRNAPVEGKVDPGLTEALGVAPKQVLIGANAYFCIFDTEEQVRALKPNMDKVAALDQWSVIVTAPSSDADCVSRFFAPAKGIPEDPVTGRAHTVLTPYWAQRLGKKKIFARQISARVGELWCEDLGSRVKIAGRAIPYLEGTIEVPAAAAA